MDRDKLPSDNKVKPWTTTEEKYMRQHYGFIKVAKIAEHLGRTEEAIRQKANRLNLGSKLCRQTSKKIASDVLKYLIYEGYTATQIANEVGMDRRSINLRVKSPDFDDFDRRYLLKSGREYMKRKRQT